MLLFIFAILGSLSYKELMFHLRYFRAFEFFILAILNTKHFFVYFIISLKVFGENKLLKSVNLSAFNMKLIKPVVFTQDLII